MYKIETRIKKAFDEYKESGNLLKLTKKVADVADYSVQSQGNAAIMYNAINKYCPLTLFECVFYDGESGVYHLLDFDPNIISRESLLIEIRSRLEREFYSTEPDYIDKAMENVYLLNVNTLVKIEE